MVGSAVIGWIAALVAFLPRYLDVKFPLWMSSIPISILGVLAALGVILGLSSGSYSKLKKKFTVQGGADPLVYTGLADLLVYIHSPFKSDSWIYWTIRGLISFLLTLLGGLIGPEGAAIEWAHALQSKRRVWSSRWFEQRRRTDTAVSVAAGLSAAFGAPFAGVLFSLELGIGGPTLYSAVSAISAFLGFRFLTMTFSIEEFNVSSVLAGFYFSSWLHGLAVALLGGIAGVVAGGMIHFILTTQVQLRRLFPQPAMRVCVATALLILLLLIHQQRYSSSQVLFEQVLWGRGGQGAAEVGFLFFYHTLCLVLILAGFGAVGIFWPLFSLGGILGFGIQNWLLYRLVNFSEGAGLIGAAAFLGAVLEVPFASIVLVYEVTQNVQMILPCAVACIIAKYCRQIVVGKALTVKTLELQGVSWISGRSLSVLDSLSVRETMVVDHTVVSEQDAVSELYAKLIESRYPFLPVISEHGMYKGVLTADMIQGSNPGQESVGRSNLLEAKDLLYQSRFKYPVVKVTDSLSAVSGLFDETPCVIVLSDEGRVLGLLLVYAVRLAYDNEMARQSSLFGLNEESRHAK